MSDQRIAMVTGAGTGIGRAVAERLAHESYMVALVGRRRSVLNQAAEAITAATGNPDAARAFPTDVADPDSCVALVRSVRKAYGRVDVLINNAGVAELWPLDSISVDQIRTTLEVNLMGPILLVRELWPVFAEQGKGCVVNVSSMSTVDPFPGLGVYGAAKSGLEGLTRAVMAERGKIDLRAFSVAPGAVETEMLRSMFSADDLGRERTLSPDEVAGVIVDCVLGRREEDLGRTILLPSP
ncbi:MAG: SDR family oxidoreductase [Phycisphaerales bacterium]|nr:MAG: SDR family oxidoreductase [Phycisphaerales bacterium]